MKKTILLLSIFLMISKGLAQGIKNKEVIVEPYLSVQNYEHFKRFVLISDDVNIEYIKGFEFEWGYKYVLDIKEVKLSPELSDGTRYEHSLIAVISKTKVPDDYQFKMGLTPTVYYDDSVSSFKKIDETTYRYLDEVNIEIPSELALLFQKLLAEKQHRVGYFSHVDANTIRLDKLL